MIKPLVPWECKDINHENLIWRKKYDDRYLAEAHRGGKYTAHLYIFDHPDNDRQIAHWNVSLTPGTLHCLDDTDDLEEWKEKVSEFLYGPLHEW